MLFVQHRNPEFYSMIFNDFIYQLKQIIMKLTTLFIVVAFLISGFNVQSQKVKPGSVAGIAKVNPATENITGEQFETFYLEEFFPVFKKASPSVPFVLMKGERGAEKGKYAEFYVFESLKERDRWFPEEGVSSEETKQGFEKMGETWDKYIKLIDSGSSGSTDYIVLPFSGQSLNVKSGNVLGVFEVELTLAEGMTFEKLELLYQTEYLPAIMKNFPGVQCCVMKGDRGERTGKYIEFIVFKSMEERNRWFPEPGKSSEEAKKAFYNMREIQDRMVKMYSSVTSTDYVVL